MKLSVLIAECSFFTTDTHDARWRLALHLSRQQIIYNPCQTFLGNTYNQQLTLVYISPLSAASIEVPGVNRLYHEMFILRCTYIATGRSTVEYVAAARLTWVSLSTLERLDMCQRYAERVISGQIKSTPVEAILARADVPTFATRTIQLSTIAMEKSL